MRRASDDPKPSPEAAEAADHAVGDEQHAVPRAHVCDALDVAGRRQPDAPRADHRLEHEGGDAAGPARSISASSAATLSYGTRETSGTSGPQPLTFGSIPPRLVP